MKEFIKYILIGLAFVCNQGLFTSCTDSSKVNVLPEHPESSELKITNNETELDFGHSPRGTIFDNEEVYQYAGDSFNEQVRMLLFTTCETLNKNYFTRYNLLFFSRVPFSEIKEGTRINVVMLPYQDNNESGFDGKRYEGQVEVAKKSDDCLTIRFKDVEFRQTDNQDKVWHLNGLVNYNTQK